MTQLRIAGAAATPLYLPLYVAQEYQFFDLQVKHTVEVLEPPDGRMDGDGWAAAQVADNDAEFAVCDPRKTEVHRDLRAIAALLNKAAFWAVCAEKDITRMSDFHRFSHIVTYPRGMTARRIAQGIASMFRRRIAIRRAAIDAEFQLLLNANDRRCVAITANLLYAVLFAQHYENFRVSEIWPLHPNFYSFALTGLLTTRQLAYADAELVRNLVRAIARGVAIVATDEELAAKVLFKKFKDRKLCLSSDRQVAITETLAREIVRKLNGWRVFPAIPLIDLTAWHNAQITYGTRTLKHKPALLPAHRLDEHSRAYENYVMPQIAAAVEAETLRLVVAFSQSDRNYDVMRSLLQIQPFSLERITVIGNYCKYDPVARDQLAEWVARIRRGVVEPGTELENYLIWGRSGTGKSYLIQELGRILQSSGLARYFEINFADVKLDRERVVQVIAEISGSDIPSLCLLDEIHADNATNWGYEAIYRALELRTAGKRVAYALVGSKPGGLEALSTHISSSPKMGADVQSRLPADRRFAIPDPTREDKIAVIVAQITVNAKLAKRNISQIEKLALYYLLVHPDLKQPRLLAQMVLGAVQRIPAGDGRLKYEHLFAGAKSDEKQNFWAQHISAASALAHTYLAVEDHGPTA